MALTVEYSQTITGSNKNDMAARATQNFALVLTNNPELPRWQIHHRTCEDASQLRLKGAFVDLISAESPELLVESELRLYALASLKDGRSEKDFEIMPCCKG